MRTREVWSGRSVFILAAIGSAVGLGNIWRFPYIAYENGGGAFIVPYLVALLTAGIPLLFVDYAIGHKFRGSPPLAFHRLKRATESLGWWQVGICFVIGVYYAVIIAWALRYTFFSATRAWGDDAEAFFLQDFLQMDADATFGLDFVPGAFEWDGGTPADWAQVEGWHGDVAASRSIRPLTEADLLAQARDFRDLAERHPNMRRYLDHHRPFHAAAPCRNPRRQPDPVRPVGPHVRPRLEPGHVHRHARRPGEPVQSAG